MIVVAVIFSSIMNLIFLVVGYYLGAIRNQSDDSYEED